jgi:oxygen-independent coproporphyrinogen-3 oxidase
MAPDHVSLYALWLDDPEAEGMAGPAGDHLPVTKGARRWREAVRPGQDEDRAAAQYHHAVVTLADAGYRGYEISNWARPGHESRHNLAYWLRQPHEAVGPGAHAYDGVTRRWNAARLDAYVGALVGRGELPPGGAIATEPLAATVEAMVLALRLDTGIPLAAAYEPPLADHFGWALALELLTVTEDDRVVLTTRGRLLSNELFHRLI